MKMRLVIYDNGVNYLFFEDRFSYLTNVTGEFSQRHICDGKFRSVTVMDDKILVNGKEIDYSKRFYVRNSVYPEVLEKWITTGKYL